MAIFFLGFPILWILFIAFAFTFHSLGFNDQMSGLFGGLTILAICTVCSFFKSR